MNDDRKFPSKHHEHIPTTSTPTELLDQKRKAIIKAQSTEGRGERGTTAGGRESEGEMKTVRELSR